MWHHGHSRDPTVPPQSPASTPATRSLAPRPPCMSVHLRMERGPSLQHPLCGLVAPPWRGTEYEGGSEAHRDGR